MMRNEAKRLRGKFTKKREGVDDDGRDGLFHAAMLTGKQERSLSDVVMEELRAKAKAREESDD